MTDGIFETYCSGGKTQIAVLVGKIGLGGRENQIHLTGGNKAVCPCPLRDSAQTRGIRGF